MQGRTFGRLGLRNPWCVAPLRGGDHDDYWEISMGASGATLVTSHTGIEALACVVPNATMGAACIVMFTAVPSFRIDRRGATGQYTHGDPRP